MSKSYRPFAKFRGMYADERPQMWRIFYRPRHPQRWAAIREIAPDLLHLRTFRKHSKARQWSAQ